MVVNTFPIKKWQTGFSGLVWKSVIKTPTHILSWGIIPFVKTFLEVDRSSVLGVKSFRKALETNLRRVLMTMQGKFKFSYSQDLTKWVKITHYCRRDLKSWSRVQRVTSQQSIMWHILEVWNGRSLKGRTKEKYRIKSMEYFGSYWGEKASK